MCQRTARFRALLSLVAVLAIAFVGCSPTYVEEETFSFKAEDIYGDTVALSDDRYVGKVVLIDIWGAWCPPCLEQIPYLIDWQERYGDDGLRIVSVEFASHISQSREDYIAGLRGWVDEQGVNYPVIQGGETTDVTAFFPELRNFKGFPTSIFIGRDGRVRHVKAGFFESEVSWYEKTIRSLLTERPDRGA